MSQTADLAAGMVPMTMTTMMTMTTETAHWAGKNKKDGLWPVFFIEIFILKKFKIRVDKMQANVLSFI